MARFEAPPIAVSITHAAQLLDVSRQHVYQLAARGQLRLVRVANSRAVRVPMADIYAALGLNETPATGSPDRPHNPGVGS